MAPIEFAELASKISVAQKETEGRNQPKPFVSELPEGAYDARQLARFRRVDGLIDSAFGKVLNEAGIENYLFARDFSHVKKGLGNKSVVYRVLFRDDGEPIVEGDKKEYRHVGLAYDPGGRLDGESLHLGSTQILVPKGRFNSRPDYTLDEALLHLEKGDASVLDVRRLVTMNINKERVDDLVKIGVAGAITIKPSID